MSQQKVKESLFTSSNCVFVIRVQIRNLVIIIKKKALRILIGRDNLLETKRPNCFKLAGWFTVDFQILQRPVITNTKRFLHAVPSNMFHLFMV